MGQRRRCDGPGVRHHVMNRGVGKRLMFAGRRDRRQFLCGLARAFRRSQLHVEAYALLGTHFHLLVRTDAGTLSEGMRRVQNGFSRWFNRRNRRDGPLVRARFRSRPVTSEAHLFAALPYLDFNAVKAGLCTRPAEYEGGSARHFLTDEFPRWLSPDGILARLRSRAVPGEPTAQTYARLFNSGPTPLEIELIENRFRAPVGASDDLDYLLEAPSDRALAWIQEKARNADGMRPACALIPPGAIEQAIGLLSATWGSLSIPQSRKSWDGWTLALFGLQNSLAGHSGAALAARHGVSQSTASRYVRAHRRTLIECADYAEASRLVTVEAIARTYRR